MAGHFGLLRSHQTSASLGSFPPKCFVLPVLNVCSSQGHADLSPLSYPSFSVFLFPVNSSPCLCPVILPVRSRTFSLRSCHWLSWLSLLACLAGTPRPEPGSLSKINCGPGPTVTRSVPWGGQTTLTLAFPTSGLSSLATWVSGAQPGPPSRS